MKKGVFLKKILLIIQYPNRLLIRGFKAVFHCFGLNPDLLNINKSVL